MMDLSCAQLGVTEVLLSLPSVHVIWLCPVLFCLLSATRKQHTQRRGVKQHPTSGGKTAAPHEGGSDSIIDTQVTLSQVVHSSSFGWCSVHDCGWCSLLLLVVPCHLTSPSLASGPPFSIRDPRIDRGKSADTSAYLPRCSRRIFKSHRVPPKSMMCLGPWLLLALGIFAGRSVCAASCCRLWRNPLLDA